MKKEITFFINNEIERSIFDSISIEANKRNYKVYWTYNPFKTCEIGFYLDHSNNPEGSKLSVIMLHDLLQNSGLWPNIWELEPWHIYDIGILPNDIWRNNWVQAAKNYYAHPKYGIFLAGWPKADKYLEKVNNRNYFRNEKNREFVILYAPSFEIENKQDDIVQACKDLGVKLLIKHYPIEQKKEPELFNNIISVQNKHKNIEFVESLDPKINIFEALLKADLLVSDISSTLAEAQLFGIPSIHVSDWKVVNYLEKKAHTLPKSDFDFTINTTKANLSETIRDVKNNYNKYLPNRKISSEPSKKSSVIIMDIIDAIITKKRFEKDPLSYHLSISKNRNKTEFFLRYFIYRLRKFKYEHKILNLIYYKIVSIFRER